MRAACPWSPTTGMIRSRWRSNCVLSSSSCSRKRRRLARAIPTTNPAAKTGALKLVLQALERLTEWQRYVGVLPAKLAPEIEVRAVASTIMDVFEQYGVGEDAQDAVMEALQPESAEAKGLPPVE